MSRRHPLRPSGWDTFLFVASIVGPVTVLVLVVCNVGPFG